MTIDNIAFVYVFVLGVCAGVGVSAMAVLLFGRHEGSLRSGHCDRIVSVSLPYRDAETPNFG